MACAELGSTTSSTVVAESSTTTAEPASAVSVYGTWEGTYTPLAAWDENGTVDDPPVTIGAPVALHLELHAWSEAAGDYGTLIAAGFSGNRVADLSFDGQVLRLSITCESPGREDSHTVITALYQGDTLAGQDSGDPQVPPGWVSTSGTVVLARATSSATSETETTATSETETDSGGHAGGSEGDEGSAAGAGETITSEPRTFEVGESDNNHTIGLHVGDVVRIELSPIPQDQVTEVGFWHGAHAVEPVPSSQGTTKMIGNVTKCWIEFTAVAPGNDQIGATYIHTDGTVEHPWVIHVTVIE